MIIYSSINTLVDDILGVIRANSSTQSETISKTQIEGWIHQYRSLLIKQDLDKGRYVNPDYIQEIPAIKLIPVDYSDKSKLKTQAYRYKTSIKIPKSLDLHFNNGLTFVGDLLNNEIQLIPESRSNWIKFRKYTSMQSFCYLNEGYLYLESQQLLEYVKVRGVFEYPMELTQIVNPLTNIIVYDPNDKYPVPSNMIPVIRQMILEKELKITVSVPIDSTNDSNQKIQNNASN